MKKKFKTRVSINGKRNTYTFDSQEELDRFTASLKFKRFRNYRKGKTEYLTLGFLFSEYIKTSGFLSLKNSTRINYLNSFKLLEHLNSRFLHSITNQDLSSLLSKGFHASRLSCALRLLDRIANYTLIHYSYSSGFSVGAFRKQVKVRVSPVKKDSFHTKVEIGKILSVLNSKESWSRERAIRKNLDWFKHFYIIGISTGMRIGEICALRKEDFCEDTGTIYVRGSATTCSVTGKHIISDSTKNGEHRKLELNSQAVQSMIWFRDNSPAGSPYLIFSRNNNHSFSKTTEFGNFIKRICRVAGVRELSSHSAFRKTFATHLAVEESKAGRHYHELLFNLQKFLGHKSPTMTLRYIQNTSQGMSSSLKSFGDSIFNQPSP